MFIIPPIHTLRLRGLLRARWHHQTLRPRRVARPSPTPRINISRVHGTRPSLPQRVPVGWAPSCLVTTLISLTRQQSGTCNNNPRVRPHTRSFERRLFLAHQVKTDYRFNVNKKRMLSAISIVTPSLLSCRSCSSSMYVSLGCFLVLLHLGEHTGQFYTLIPLPILSFWTCFLPSSLLCSTDIRHVHTFV